MSFTVDVYVISISLYSWIIICLYSDSVLHCEYECDIYFLVVRSLGLGRGFNTSNVNRVNFSNGDKTPL